MIQIVQKVQFSRRVLDLTYLVNGWNGLNRFLSVRRVRALADHDHAVMMEHHHFPSICLCQNRGIEDLLRLPFGDQPAVQTNGPGKVSGHPIQIVRGDRQWRHPGG